MIKLPNDLKEFNMTNEEYMALTTDERIFLNSKIGCTEWAMFSEANPDIEKPKLPCIINGIIIGE